MANFVFKDNSAIGNLEAETDTFLEECFIETPSYKILSVFDDENPEFYKRIIVGRTGSGKTALLKKLVEGSTITKKDIIEAEKTIFDHIKNDKFISNLIAQGIDLKIFYKALWVHVILVKMIELIHTDIGLIEVIKNASINYRQSEKIKSYLNKYQNKFFDDDVLVEITREFKAGVESEVKIPSISVTAITDSNEKQKIQSETNNYVNRELLQSQKSIIGYLAENSVSDKQKKIVISIDDLDKSWFQSDNVHYDFINALLEAFKELLVIKTVKILISIRTDILEGVYQNKLKQDEKDLSLILAVEWTRDEIRELLDKRISHLIKDQYAQKRFPKLVDIFDFEMFECKADDYILDRTMMRPRDAIDFVNLCFKAANGETKITKTHLSEAEEIFYSSRKNALVKEWVGLHSEIKCYLDALSFVKTKIFSLAELLAYFKNFEDFMISNIQDEDSKIIIQLLGDQKDNALKFLVSIWFQTGVIGIKKQDDVIIKSSFQKRELDITDYSKSFIVHPLFWREEKF